MSTKGNCKESVLNYLVDQNRPYSANDVMQNLHNEYNRAAVQKALDELSSENRIREKLYGKQKVYSCLQPDEKDSIETAIELNELDTKIGKVSEELKTIEEELKETDVQVKYYQNLPDTETALQEISELEKEIIKLDEKVQSLSDCAVKISEDEKNKLNKEFEYYSNQHKKRKRICMDILNSILENYPKKMKVLFEEIGIETDDV